MTPSRLLTFLLLACAPAFAALDGPPRSVSSSKQFVIYCTDPKLRTATAVHAEGIKREFLSTLRDTKDSWKTPIIIQFGPPPNVKRPPRSKIGIFEGDDGQNKIQLDIYDAKLAKEPDFDSQVLTALALEYMYRSTRVRAGRPFEQPPSWFVEGLAENIRTRETGLPASVYAGLLSGGEAPRIADFVSTQPARLDATSRAVYQAQAGALLEVVSALPDGPAGLRTYLSQPRRYPSNVDELVAIYPVLGGNREALARKWVLAIARASAANRSNLLSERESSRELAGILDIKPLPDPKRPEVAAMSGPYALPTIARSQNGKFILAQLENNLLRLSMRAHPLYKSLVDEYLRIVRDLARKPKSKQEKRIATAEDMRARLNRETSELRDFMDWVETTKIKTESPELNKVMEDVEELEQPSSRSDAISRYLDAASERGW